MRSAKSNVELRRERKQLVGVSPGDHKVQACSLGLMGDHTARVARRAIDEELLHD
jgi:hypothetical protein